ncbi:hypothetical protein MXB_3159 [Myxobolus squamalis]|nr:hypothetical protein MXB_3159 [Myxobolus squamalis]
MTACNLIINYLPSDANESEVENMFKEYGNVESVKIIKNKQTGVSMCYGFVVMTDEECGKAAISALNQKPLRGKFLRVNIAKAREEIEKDEVNTNLYVTGISNDTSEELVEKLFSKFGEIVSIKVVKNNDGSNRGIGFVKFMKREDAETAIEQLNGSPFCHRDCPQEPCMCSEILIVKFALPHGKNSKKNLPQPVAFQSVPFSYPPQLMGNCVMGLHAAQYTNMLYANPQAMQYYGVPCTSIGIPPFPHNPLINTSPSVQLSAGTHCLFVYGLSQATTDEELQSIFLPFGAVSNCRVCFDSSNGKRVCKGFGFVNYYSFNDAQAAINSLNNLNYKGHVLQVRFKSTKDSYL